MCVFVVDNGWDCNVAKVSSAVVVAAVLSCQSRSYKIFFHALVNVGTGGIISVVEELTNL